jgi:hypothetical protein
VYCGKKLQEKRYLDVYEISIADAVYGHLRDKNKKQVRAREAEETVDALIIT